MKELCGRCKKQVEIRMNVVKSKEGKKMYKATCPICKRYIKWLSNDDLKKFFRERNERNAQKADKDYFDKFR